MLLAYIQVTSSHIWTSAMNFHSNIQETNYDRQSLSTNGHQYESLTGLLLQENTPISFYDDDSFKHQPPTGLEEESNTKRERNENRRARSLLRGTCSKIKRTCCKSYDSPLVVLLGLCVIGAVGAFIGFLIPSKSEDRSTTSLHWNTISSMLGYTYFLSWTLSFYPQILTNCIRPQDARQGVSIDFLVWNMIGFVCYTVYVTSFMYSDDIRREYADRFGGPNVSVLSSLRKVLPWQAMISSTSGDAYLGEIADVHLGFYENQTSIFHISTTDIPNSNSSSSMFDNSTISGNSTGANRDTIHDSIAEPQVKLNDVAFAWHALLLSIITYVQIVWCSKKSKQEDPDGNENSIECSVRHTTPLDSGWDTPQSNDVSPTDGGILFNEQRQIHLRRQMQLQGIHEQLESLVESEPSHRFKSSSQQVSFTSKCLMIILLKFCIAGVLMVLIWSRWQWIDYLYFLSFVKVCISIVKYIPQVNLHFSTWLWRDRVFIVLLTGSTLIRLFLTTKESPPKDGRFGIFCWILPGDLWAYSRWDC